MCTLDRLISWLLLEEAYVYSCWVAKKRASERERESVVAIKARSGPLPSLPFQLILRGLRESRSPWERGSSTSTFQLFASVSEKKEGEKKREKTEAAFRSDMEGERDKISLILVNFFIKTKFVTFIVLKSDSILKTTLFHNWILNLF